ncbi:MAG: RecQ family ATP-dependent DNA helicase, partial [Spirochaetota bacterium]|nr:RecQ family ATP-dependent DNA helicase [Spirochaetota bacterium]
MFWNKITRKFYEEQLVKQFNIPSFFDTQWKIIRKLLKKKRVLLIERTGFGKSLCYQFPATLFKGITIVLSPLISLMRDQVKQLAEVNIPANLIYSGQTYNERSEILLNAQKGVYKLLYISPERQGNELWLDAVSKMDISMLVIDEAHCISEWGHDFRPSYQKIVNTVKQLPRKFPILATTATASYMAIRDVKSQIGRISIHRGNLDRPNFQLSVISVRNEKSKYCYIKQILNELDGIGLVYCGIRSDTEFYAGFFKKLGINATSYHGGLSNKKREEIEKGLMENKYQIVCSTNALGMGLNKKDIRFIIHTKFPASLSHYYQEIGRAGRDNKESKIILLYNSRDDYHYKRKISIDYPNKKDYLLVYESLKKAELSIDELLIETGLSRNKLRLIITELEKNKNIKSFYQAKKLIFKLVKLSKRFKLSHHEKHKNHKILELNKIHEYAKSNYCRIKYLRNYFNDTTSKTCTRCDSCRKEKHYFMPHKEDLSYVEDFFNSFYPELSVISDNKKTIAHKTSKLVNGVACSYYGKTDLGIIVSNSKYRKGDEFPELIINRAT